jgi:hypothetical protein
MGALSNLIELAQTLHMHLVGTSDHRMALKLLLPEQILKFSPTEKWASRMPSEWGHDLRFQPRPLETYNTHPHEP